MPKSRIAFADRVCQRQGRNKNSKPPVSAEQHNKRGEQFIQHCRLDSVRGRKSRRARSIPRLFVGSFAQEEERVAWTACRMRSQRAGVAVVGAFEHVFYNIRMEPVEWGRAGKLCIAGWRPP